MRGKLLRGIRNVALLVTPSLLVCLVLGELLFTFVIPASRQPHAVFDPEDEILRYDTDGPREGVFTVGNFAQQRGRWRINNAGWNSEIDYLAKTERTKPLVAIIGDSFVEGFHVDVDENVAALLQQHFGDEVDVYGFGMSGASLSQYLHMSRYVKRHFDPDVMVVVVIHNDLDESVRELHAQSHMLQVSAADSTFVEVRPSPYHPNRTRRFLGRSAFIRYMTLNLKLPQLIRGLGRGDDTAYRSNVDVDAVSGERKLIEGATRFLVERLRAEIQPANLLVVMDALRADIYYGSVAESDIAWMNDLMRSACEELGVDYVDLTADFARYFAETGERFNTEIDFHWNEVGHREAAAVIHERLRADAVDRLR